MRTNVCLVFHSGTPLLERTLESLRTQTLGLRIAVVDTSYDQVASQTCLDHGVLHVEAADNGGYAWALHRGFDALAPADDEVFVASNSDIIYLDGAIATLSTAAAHPRTVAYPTQLTGEEGRVAPYNALDLFDRMEAVSRWTGVGRRSLAARRERFIAELESSGAAFLPFPPGIGGSGACFAMRAGTWRSSGGLDRRFFLYEEDREFAGRISDLGYEAVICPSARVVHEGGISRTGLTLFTLQEALLSERLYWEMKGYRPRRGALMLQHFGAILRYARAAGRRDREGMQLYSALGARLRTYYRSNPVPRTESGLRVPLEAHK